MIKIRYRDADELSPGLHAAAEEHGRNITVFLLPGLTSAERRAALRRLRLSARMGYCPPLPAAQLALALVADRIRTTVGQVGTLIRSHPAGSTVPVMVLSAGAIAFLALSAVSIQVLHIPGSPGRSSALANAAGGSSSATPSPSPDQAQPTAGQTVPGPADPGTGQLASTSQASASPSRTPAAAVSSSAAAPSTGVTPSPTTPVPDLTLRAAPSPTQPAASASASPAVAQVPPPVMQVPSPSQSSAS